MTFVSVGSQYGRYNPLADCGTAAFSLMPFETGPFSAYV
jgi:hypothetical protein